jgi:hypothetical protein
MRPANWCATVLIICTACGLPTADEGVLGTPRSPGVPEPPAIPYEEVVWPWQTGFFGDHMERSHAINQLTSREGSWCYFIALSAVQRGGDEGGIRRRFSFHPVLATRRGVHPSQRPSGPDLIEHIQLSVVDGEELAYLEAIPELRSLGLRVEGQLGGGLRHLQHCEYLRILSIVVPDSKREGDLPVTEADLAAIARLPSLQALTLTGVPIDDDAFDHLRDLPRLKYLTLMEMKTLSPRIFQTIATWPAISHVEILRHTEFAEPIDEQTARAIASLDGRLRWLVLDEPQQQGDLAFLPFTPVDASFIPPLAEIQSLRRLVLGPVEGGPRHKVLAPLRQLPDYRRVVRGEFIAEQKAQERP